MNFLNKIKIAFGDSYIRNRVLAILLGIIVFRLLSAVPIPGIDSLQLENFLGGDNQFLGLLNIFSGGGLSSLSIIMLGVGPYITASIIMQLLTVMVPKFKRLYHEEGQIGREQFNQISRFLTVPIAVVQGLGLLLLLTQQGIISQMSPMTMLFNILIVTAGAVLIMWIGEVMSEYGIGSGVSILIFAGIIATLPTVIQQLVFTFDVSQIPTLIGFVIVAVLIIAGIVLISESERPIPVVYSKQVRGGQVYGGTSTYVPLRINMAGVMPIIFALSILLFPQFLAGLLAQSDAAFWQGLSNFFLNFVNNGWLYSIVYFLLVFGFTYFYTAITFDAEAMAENLQKSGAFVPGVRPGEQTAEYVGTVLGRITFVGALFLASIAVIPVAIQSITGIQALAIGGTGLLIVVAVILDLIKRIDAQISMREY
ncbi:MAG: preprotein translocase subunit SecY [Planctomycetota bacterium]|jgi:preprotein translocase subunit SecY